VRLVTTRREIAAPPWHERRLVETRLQGAIVLSKLWYASPAWWGSTSMADKQRLGASVRRAIRLGLYSADDPTPSQLAADMDDNLFANILNNPHRVLHKISRGQK